MSDDLVKHCICGCMYTEADCPNCNKVTDAARIEELEAKLEKAVEIGNKMAKSIEGNYYIPGVVKEWRTTLAELKGDNQ